MQLKRSDPLRPKGWYFGPWDYDLGVSLGYANEGIDKPHFHQRMSEVYMVARGTAEIRIEQETVELSQGDVIIIEPGEAHTFLSSSSDYFHFVMQLPALAGDEAIADKVPVPDARFGL